MALIAELSHVKQIFIKLNWKSMSFKCFMKITFQQTFEDVAKL